MSDRPVKKSSNSASLSNNSVSHDEWLSRIQDIQMRRITPEQRADLLQRATSRQMVAKKAKASRNIEMRSKNALYHQCQVSMDVSSTSATDRAERRAPPAMATPSGATTTTAASSGMDFLSNFFGVSSSRPPPRPEASGAPASGTAPPPLIVGHEEYARQSMALMDDMDSAWANALRRDEAEEAGRANDDFERAEEIAEAVLTVADSDLEAMLDDLKVEPASDDLRAAKFQIFEKFSERVGVIRSALDEVAESALHDLPDAAKGELRRDMKKLDSAEHCGINDLSRVWFVHQMASQVSKNCKTMEALSRSIGAKLRMIAESTQSECPVCIRRFETAPGAGAAPAGGDDEERCKPKILSCCHAVCVDCWDHWVALRGPHATCPLCRQREFLEFIATPPSAVRDE